jgi:hypothetical protein
MCVYIHNDSYVGGFSASTSKQEVTHHFEGLQAKRDDNDNQVEDGPRLSQRNPEAGRNQAHCNLDNEVQEND